MARISDGKSRPDTAGSNRIAHNEGKMMADRFSVVDCALDDAPYGSISTGR
jgi:hypothetical protein